MKLEGLIKTELAKMPVKYEIVRKRDHYFAVIEGELVLVAGSGTKFKNCLVASCVSKLRKIRKKHSAH